MSDYLQYIGVVGFLALIACQLNLWCKMYHTCGVVWSGFKSLFKRKEK